MFDNRWDNWAGDFSESFAASQLDPDVRTSISEILTHFGNAVRRIDRSFPDKVSSGTFATVLAEVMPRLNLPASARPHVPEVIARFLEYLQESGRVGEGDEWAAQVRVIDRSTGERGRPVATSKAIPIRNPGAGGLPGRNDPCPCGSGKKYKKCCHSRV
jgi:hypothetical protein